MQIFLLLLELIQQFANHKINVILITQASSEHFDNSQGGGDGGGEYPLRIRGDWLSAELVRYSN